MFAWIKRTYRPLSDLRITVIVLALSAWVVLYLDQGRDVVRGLADTANMSMRGWLPAAGPSVVQWGLFLFACVWTGLNAWYWANLLYKSRGTSEQPGWFRWARRLLGVAPLLCAIWAMYLSSVHGLTDVWVGMTWFGGAAILLLAFFIFRPWVVRVLDGIFGGRFTKPVTGRLAAIGNGKMVPGDVWFVGTSLFITTLMLLLFIIPVVRTEVAWALGPAALSFGAIGCIIPVTSLVIWLTRSRGVPVISVGLVAFALFSLWNNNHDVRLIDQRPRTDRPMIEAAFAQWQTGHTAPTDPVVLVATAGGASRAAYWTATVLRALDDNTDGAFSGHVFAISSVSGGSLGAIGYVAWLADHPPHPDKNGAPPRRHFVQSFFGQDYLGPSIAGLLFPDLVQRFLSFPVSRLDRAASLEESWEQGWRVSMDMCDPVPCGKDDRFSDDYLKIWDKFLPARQAGDAPKPGEWIPIVLANGTHVGSGKRIITAPVAVTTDVFEDSYDFFDLVSGGIRASTAAHNSARFPIISPAGNLARGNISTGQIVDGGYFENGGLETAYDVARFIHRVDPQRQIVIIEINNDDRASDGDRARHPGPPEPLPVTPAEDYPTANFLSEFTSIIEALYQTGNGRGTLAAKRISELAISGLGSAKFYRFQLGPLANERRTTMSWAISQGGRDAMDVAFISDPAKVEQALEGRNYSEARRQTLIEELTQVIGTKEAKLNREQLNAVVEFVVGKPADYQPPAEEMLEPVK